MLKIVGRVLLVAGLVYVGVFVFHTLRAHSDARTKEARLETFVERPPFEYDDVLRISREDITFGRIVRGQLVEHLLPLQLYVDTGGQLDYWKPLYGVSAEVFFGTTASPRDACRELADDLQLDGDTCIAERAECLEGARQAGLKTNDCARHFESGILLRNPARPTQLTEHVVGSVRFKKGRYLDFGADEGLVERRIGPPDKTVIHVSVEITD